MEQASRGVGGPWTGGPGGLNWNGIANERVRAALGEEDSKERPQAMVDELDELSLSCTPKTKASA